MGFEELAVAGRKAVLEGRHEVESPPDDDSLRWGPSAILRPDANALLRTEAWTADLVQLAGRRHWRTGSARSAHITVRSLDVRRTSGVGEPARRIYSAAVDSVAEELGRASFRATGLLVSPISVMLALAPEDDSARNLAVKLEQHLGPEGWFEQGRVRDIWYLNLIHFTGPIDDPTGLVRWVDEQDAPDLAVESASLQVARWDFDGDGMIPSELAGARLR